jgi:hypothetical protein
MRKLKWAAAATSLLGLLTFAAPQAGAEITGAVAFQCTASLPAFPSPGGSGTCSGTSLLAVGGSLSTAGGAYVLADTHAAGPNNFSSSFSYLEPCVVVGEPPLAGTASGTATISGLNTVRVLPTPATGLTTTISTGFNWTRVGVVAVILTEGTTATVSDGGQAVSAQDGTALDGLIPDDVAVAAFAPLNFDPLVHACPVGGALSAAVVGIDINPV